MVRLILPFSICKTDITKENIRLTKVNEGWLLDIIIDLQEVRKLVNKTHSDPNIAKATSVTFQITKEEGAFMLEHWIKDEPRYWCNKFIEYYMGCPEKLNNNNRNDYKTITSWRARALEEGKMFSNDHPSGAGYYYEKELDRIYSERYKNQED